MDGYIAIGTIFVVICFWNLLIAILGLFPQCCSCTVGTLIDTNTTKNVYTPRGRKIPILTQYAYTYTVKGKEYTYAARGEHSKRRLPLKSTMVYVKWFPWRAYPENSREQKNGPLVLLCSTQAFG